MISVRNWNKDTTYENKDVVLFYDKLYVAMESNTGILPIPAVDYPTVDIDGTQVDIEASNMEEVMIIARSIFNTTDEIIKSSHLNINSTWRVLS